MDKVVPEDLHAVLLRSRMSCAESRVFISLTVRPPLQHLIYTYMYRYLSEAGASLVDAALGLHVVPKTKVVRLASSTFYYGRIKRYRAQAARTAAEHFPDIGVDFRESMHHLNSFGLIMSRQAPQAGSANQGWISANVRQGLQGVLST